MARELARKGLHVAHVVIDGTISGDEDIGGTSARTYGYRRGPLRSASAGSHRLDPRARSKTDGREVLKARVGFRAGDDGWYTGLHAAMLDAQATRESIDE